MPRLLSAAMALLVGLLVVLLIDLTLAAAGVLADVNRAQVSATGKFTQCEGCTWNTITLRFNADGGPVTGEAHIVQPIPDWGKCARTVDANVLEEDSSYSADTGKLTGKAQVREVTGGDPMNAYCGLASGETIGTQDWSATWKDDKVTGSGLGGGDFELRTGRERPGGEEPAGEPAEEPGEEAADGPGEDAADEPGEEAAEEPGAATKEDDEGGIGGAARDAAEQLYDSGGRPSKRDLAVTGTAAVTVVVVATSNSVVGSSRRGGPPGAPAATQTPSLDQMIAESRKRLDLLRRQKQQTQRDIDVWRDLVNFYRWHYWTGSAPRWMAVGGISAAAALLSGGLTVFGKIVFGTTIYTFTIMNTSWPPPQDEAAKMITKFSSKLNSAANRYWSLDAQIKSEEQRLLQLEGKKLFSTYDKKLGLSR